MGRRETFTPTYASRSRKGTSPTSNRVHQPWYVMDSKLLKAWLIKGIEENSLFRSETPRDKEPSRLSLRVRVSPNFLYSQSRKFIGNEWNHCLIVSGGPKASARAEDKVTYTKKDVELVMAKVVNEINSLREAGQKEYVHDEDRPFRNFEDNGAKVGIPREKAWWLMASKHIDGIVAWINGHRSQRENVRGRINDLIVFLILLRAMVEEDELPRPTIYGLDKGQLIKRVNELEQKGPYIPPTPHEGMGHG